MKETHCVLCHVRSGSLYITLINWSLQCVKDEEITLIYQGKSKSIIRRSEGRTEILISRQVEEHFQVQRPLQIPLPLTVAAASFIRASRGDTREKALVCLSPQHRGGDSEVLLGDDGRWEGGGL